MRYLAALIININVKLAFLRAALLLRVASMFRRPAGQEARS